jgi:hypothetical protein
LCMPRLARSWSWSYPLFWTWSCLILSLFLYLTLELTLFLLELVQDRHLWFRKLRSAVGSNASGWDLSNLCLSFKEWAQLFSLLTSTNLLKNTNMFDGNSNLLGTHSNPEWIEDGVAHQWQTRGKSAFEKHDAPLDEEDRDTFHLVTSCYWFTRKQRLPDLAVLLKLCEVCHVELSWDVWISSRGDCGSVYEASMPGSNFKVSFTLEPEWNHWLHQKAALQITPQITLPLEYSDRGKDDKFWGGYYGAKIYNARIRVTCGPNVGVGSSS